MYGTVIERALHIYLTDVTELYFETLSTRLVEKKALTTTLSYG